MKRRVVLCAYGITHDGVRELIDFGQDSKPNTNLSVSEGGYHISPTATQHIGQGFKFLFVRRWTWMRLP